MRNIGLQISYDGTAYAGWQVQDNAVTIQGVIEEALSRILGGSLSTTDGTERRLRLRVAGRTDAGVHAVGQIASFRTESGMKPREFQLALNSLIPFDIRVLSVFEAAPEFHPRFSARRRWYRYLVCNADTLVPFFRNYALWVARPLDLTLLNGYAERLVGTHDFTSFASVGEGERTLREVHSCGFTAKDGFVIFDIEAGSFMRKMVRTIVGTFLEMEKQGLPPDSIDEILAARDRGSAGSTAFAGGLYLMKVFY